MTTLGHVPLTFCFRHHQTSAWELQNWAAESSRFPLTEGLYICSNGNSFLSLLKTPVPNTCDHLRSPDLAFCFELLNGVGTSQVLAVGKG